MYKYYLLHDTIFTWFTYHVHPITLHIHTDGRSMHMTHIDTHDTQRIIHEVFGVSSAITAVLA